MAIHHRTITGTTRLLVAGLLVCASSASVLARADVIGKYERDALKEVDRQNSAAQASGQTRSIFDVFAEWITKALIGESRPADKKTPPPAAASRGSKTASDPVNAEANQNPDQDSTDSKAPIAAP